MLVSNLCFPVCHRCGVGHLSLSPLSHCGSGPGKVLCVVCECGLEKSSYLCSRSPEAPVNPLEQQSSAILPSFFS